jgi:hypothetical protein
MNSLCKDRRTVVLAGLAVGLTVLFGGIPAAEATASVAEPGPGTVCAIPDCPRPHPGPRMPALPPGLIHRPQAQPPGSSPARVTLYRQVALSS